MKTKIIIIAIAALGLFSSCASTCGGNSWRKRRFVEVEKPVELPQTHTIKVTQA